MMKPYQIVQPRTNDDFYSAIELMRFRTEAPGTALWETRLSSNTFFSQNTKGLTLFTPGYDTWFVPRGANRREQIWDSVTENDHVLRDLYLTLQDVASFNISKTGDYIETNKDLLWGLSLESSLDQQESSDRIVGRITLCKANEPGGLRFESAREYSGKAVSFD